MVNMVDTLTRVLKRKPTEAELGKFMEMKREQEGFKKQKLFAKQDLAKNFTKPREPRTPKAIKEYQYKWPKRASQNALRINRMLHLKMTITDIAYVLDVAENVVIAEMKKWQLPQKK